MGAIMSFEPTRVDVTVPGSPQEATARLDAMQAAFHPPPPLTPTTPAEAKARLQALTSSAEWGARLLAGNTDARQEFVRLTELAAGADQVSDAINNTTPQLFLIETIGPGELSTRDRGLAVAMFRDAGLGDAVIAEAFNGG